MVVFEIFYEFRFDLLKEIYDSVPEFKNSPNYDLAGIYAQKINPNNRNVLIIAHNPHPCGFAIAYEKPEENCLHLWLMGINDTERGKGIGRLLFNRYIEESKKLNFSKISIKTFVEKVAMVNLLDSYGMEKTIYDDGSIRYISHRC